MKPSAFASKALRFALGLQSRHVTAATVAKALPTAEFIAPTYPTGKDYSLGYAKAEILPPDIGKKKYYIAGYQENKPAKGVLDPPQTHAVWLDDRSGLGGILLISVDCVGILRSDTERIRRALHPFAMLTGCRSINIVSTHSHAGIDTMGIWGPLPRSGKDAKYMDLVIARTVAAAKEAYAARKLGKLYLGRIRVPDMQEDIRTPTVYFDTLTRLRFAPNDGSSDTYIINFAAHSESLQGCNELVSADFPCYLRRRIERETGAQTLYCVGAIGGMISMKIEHEREIRERGGDFSASTAAIGEKLAGYALSIKQEDEELLPARIGCLRQEVYFKAENIVLLLAAKIGLLAAKPYRLPGGEGFALKSEISYLEIGTLPLLLLPCEIFPELVYGGYLGAGESSSGCPAALNPPPLLQILGRDAVIIGLANDEVGYVIPPNDFMLDSEAPYLDIPRDSHGRRHYEETNSLGPLTAPAIAKTVELIAETVAKFSAI